jgi:beta-glucosidase
MTAEPKGNAALDRSFLEADLEELLRQLSIEEKISLLAGKNWWE